MTPAQANKLVVELRSHRGREPAFEYVVAHPDAELALAWKRATSGVAMFALADHYTPVRAYAVATVAAMRVAFAAIPFEKLRPKVRGMGDLSGIRELNVPTTLDAIEAYLADRTEWPSGLVAAVDRAIGAAVSSDYQDYRAGVEALWKLVGRITGTMSLLPVSSAAIAYSCATSDTRGATIARREIAYDKLIAPLAREHLATPTWALLMGKP